MTATYATVLLALATTVLAVFTGLMVCQAYGREKRDKKSRLLNEIRAWAEEAAKAPLSRQYMLADLKWKSMLNYQYSLATSEYVATIAKISFDSLSPFIQDVRAKLKQAWDITLRSLQTADQLETCEKQVLESTKKLLEEIAGIASDI